MPAARYSSEIGVIAVSLTEVFTPPLNVLENDLEHTADDVGPVGFLNELEYADGKLYANV
jgi:glutamine cyclotransferase